MTIVADADTGVLVTGATKPVAPEIPILEDAADNISRMRVGDEFGSIVDECSHEVWDRFQAFKRQSKNIPMSSSMIVGAEKTIELYEGIINGSKPDTYMRIPSSTKRIKSWSFGDDFENKSPCTRCQRLYSEWYLHEKPDTAEKKLSRLQQDLKSSSIKYTSSNRYPCTYCAEPVAAAKLYAIKHGTFTLILSKDKDGIKASDNVRVK